jgi:peroxiredoxin
MNPSLDHSNIKSMPMNSSMHEPAGAKWTRKATVRRIAIIGGGLLLLPVVLYAAFVLMTNLLWTGLSTGQPAPDFSGRDLDGNLVQLSDYRDRPVMLTFWSPDCFACREELPTLQAIASESGAEVALITIVSHLPAAEVQSFLDQQGLTIPVIVDEAGKIAPRYEVSGIPFTYLIGADGRIERTLIGAGAPGDLRGKLQAWLSTCQIDTVCSVE